ncbi:hypothetical protein E2C01_030824 [Portunus trituberculatus]|uniref:Uncharacterized protein n=1 Tax=Portunus trituberculatus TaxID=210409 RepID=A0A5B7ERG5_PORTR|nr:hypothetical protein [Portunus trituberculatus]
MYENIEYCYSFGQQCDAGSIYNSDGVFIKIKLTHSFCQAAVGLVNWEWRLICGGHRSTDASLTPNHNKVKKKR